MLLTETSKVSTDQENKANFIKTTCKNGNLMKFKQHCYT